MKLSVIKEHVELIEEYDTKEEMIKRLMDVLDDNSDNISVTKKVNCEKKYIL